MTWWDSLETVQWWSTVFNVLLAICGLLTGLLGFGALVFGFRAATLTEQRDNVREASFVETERKQQLAEQRQKEAEDEREQIKGELEAAKQRLAKTEQKTDETREQLAEAARPRTFDRDILFGFLVAIGTSDEMRISSENDSESKQLGDALQSVFSQAGFNVEYIGGMMTMGPNVYEGTFLTTYSAAQEDKPPYLDAVLTALKSSGLEVEYFTSKIHANKGKLGIWVAPKKSV